MERPNQVFPLALVRFQGWQSLAHPSGSDTLSPELPAARGAHGSARRGHKLQAARLLVRHAVSHEALKVRRNQKQPDRRASHQRGAPDHGCNHQQNREAFRL
jgi:hypothetical protein